MSGKIFQFNPYTAELLDTLKVLTGRCSVRANMVIFDDITTRKLSQIVTKDVGNWQYTFLIKENPG